MYRQFEKMVLLGSVDSFVYQICRNMLILAKMVQEDTMTISKDNYKETIAKLYEALMQQHQECFFA